jgi:poly-beta-1,6-N-acetyl-D-glucosamine synthase
MSVLFLILFCLLFLYTAVLLWLAGGFILTRFFIIQDEKKTTPVTIIICARNEQGNITACLTSIIKQDYDPQKIELIFINDASSDLTVQLAETILKKSPFRYRVISNKQQKGKKQSISYAMSLANHELIVLRDADTFTSSYQWLQTISDFYQAQQPDLIIAPVAVANHSVLLWALQAIENNILAVMACGSSFYNKAFLCNGANLIFTKKIFEKAGGYKSHLQIASGDDVFFLEDVKKIPGARVSYLKSIAAVVYTYPCYSFSSLLTQKIRWASKFKTNKNALNFLLAGLIFTVNAAWLFCFFYSFFSSTFQALAFRFIILKLLIDILLLFLASGFIKNKNLLWFSLPAGCIYPVYSCIVGIASFFAKPAWKK